MAEVHKNVALAAGVWTELTTPLGIAADARWAFEPADASVEMIETDSADPPAADSRGQRLFPGSAARPGDVRPWTRAAGRRLWARAATDATLVAAPVE